MNKKIIFLFLVLFFLASSLKVVSAYKKLCLVEGDVIPSEDNPRYTCGTDMCNVCVTDNFYPTLPSRCNNIVGCEYLDGGQSRDDGSDNPDDGDAGGSSDGDAGGSSDGDSDTDDGNGVTVSIGGGNDDNSGNLRDNRDSDDGSSSRSRRNSNNDPLNINVNESSNNGESDLNNVVLLLEADFEKKVKRNSYTGIIIPTLSLGTVLLFVVLIGLLAKIQMVNGGRK